MADPIEAAFKPLHDTLARLHLLTHLVDDNVHLTAAESQDLHGWLREMTALATDQAIEAETAASKAVQEVGA